jgi:two-component system, NarL family, response regulator NreC
MAIKILIVDDSPLVRQRLRSLLQQRVDWEICGEAANGSEALDKARELTPDLILMDFLMPVMDGLRAAVELEKILPKTPILMFSMHLSKQLIEEARKVGIRGAVAKSDARLVLEGCEAVLRNEPYFHLSHGEKGISGLD